jgi:hypothetical protein
MAAVIIAGDGGGFRYIHGAYCLFHLVNKKYFLLAAFV